MGLNVVRGVSVSGIESVKKGLVFGYVLSVELIGYVNDYIRRIKEEWNYI